MLTFILFFYNILFVFFFLPKGQQAEKAHTILGNISRDFPLDKLEQLTLIQQCSDISQTKNNNQLP